MSDLYPGTSEASEPTADGTQETDYDSTRYESEPERSRSHEHRDAGTQTMLADEDRLPTRQDTRAAAWGDNPVYEDEDDLGAEDEGDFGTPTKTSSRPGRTFVLPRGATILCTRMRTT